LIQVTLTVIEESSHEKEWRISPVFEETILIFSFEA